MDRPDLFLITNSLRWTIVITDEENNLIDADEQPTIKVLNKTESTDISSDSSVLDRVGSIGTYDVVLSNDNVSSGDQLSIEESVVIEGKTYYNIWMSLVVGSMPLGDATVINSDFLTSKDEIERVFSVDGVSNHLSDTDDTTLNEIISRATEKVLLFLRGFYQLDDMRTNVWVREQATYIACYLISIRRGDPSLYTDMYQNVMDDLHLVRAGMLNPGIASPPRPIVQTPLTDNRYYPSQRINPRLSTKTLSDQKVYVPFTGWYD